MSLTLESNYEAARRYAQAGLRVVPLKPASKEPLIADWPRRGSTNWSQIREWFHDHPDRNIGVLTGNGVFAVDIDERHDGVKSFRRLTKGRKLPYTSIAETGGGGWHYMFRASGRVPTRTGVLPGIDIRGDGAAIVVAPSIHPDTRAAYQWIAHPDQVLAQAPRWLLKFVTKTSSPASNNQGRAIEPTRTGDGEIEFLIEDAVSRFPVLKPGTRNDVMVKLACSLLGRGYDDETASDVLLEWWRHYQTSGKIGTPVKEAPKAIGQTITAIRKSGTLKRATGTDHRAACREIRLSQSQREILEQGELRDFKPAGDPQSLIPIHKVVTPEGLLCRNKSERAFVEALVVHFGYCLARDPDAPLKATFSQIAQIVEDRHGIRLKPTQIERLKSRYVDRPDKPASRCGLVVQVATGRTNVPSVFELAGLRDILNPRVALVSIAC